MSDNVQNVQNLSVKQQRFLEWLALPCSERNPHTQQEFADLLGLNEKTLRRWKKDLGLDMIAAELARDYVRADLPDIYAALKRQARKGSYQHIKLCLEVAGHYVERKEHSGPGGTPVSVRVVYDD